MKPNASLVCVVTTISPPTACIRALGERLDRHAAELVVVGDRKGPSEWSGPGTLVGIEAQRASGFALASLLPENHYTRKNLGYLLAIGQGAACIYETDDDNRPLESWAPRDLVATARTAEARPWANVYRHFSPDTQIWPRGFPLSLANDASACDFDSLPEASAAPAPIQQGLANGSPDVDAIWRLLLDREHEFGDRASLRLPVGTWCPFNSQSTWWWPVAYPLLYLPSLCSFRMTDIWRGLIAQRCLWETGAELVFHAAEVVQERNEHDLLRDFRDETPGWLGNERLVAVLELLSLKAGTDGETVGRNLLACYEALVAAEFFPPDELDMVRAWLSDLAALRSRGEEPW